MPTAYKAFMKTQVRKYMRSLGYELSPISGGLPRVQQEILSKTDLVVDVGANVGQFAERVRDLDYVGPIVSFEPTSEAFAILGRKTRSDSKWEARNIALGASNGWCDLLISDNSVSSSVLQVSELHTEAAPESRVTRTERVKMATLDGELPDARQKQIYLKLDVQGFEDKVLAGAKRLLEVCSAVQIEVSFDTLYEGQARWLDLCASLERIGMVVRFVEPGYENLRTSWMLQADFLYVRRGQ